MTSLARSGLAAISGLRRMRAAISSLSSKDYHEESEGLGVLMQIPVNPGSEDGEKVLVYLNKILKLTSQD